jgi:hypothetical protein
MMGKCRVKLYSSDVNISMPSDQVFGKVKNAIMGMPLFYVYMYIFYMENCAVMVVALIRGIYFTA